MAPLALGARAALYDLLELAHTRNLTAVWVVGLVHTAASTSAIRNEYWFQPYFRDAHTMTQHAFSATNRYESVGTLMHGVASDWSFFGF